jgi:phage-related protein
MLAIKHVRFVGSARDEISAFPKAARNRAGHELFMVQLGRKPDDWKPMASVGAGACEIRVRDRAGAFRVIYVATFKDAVYVLHAFEKKSRKTSTSDLKLARRRYRDARNLAKAL